MVGTVPVHQAYAAEIADAKLKDLLTKGVVDALSAHVYDQFRHAINVRALITECMGKALHASRLMYAPGMCPEHDRSAGNDVYSGVISAKSTVIGAWLTAVLTATVPKLWELSPTEIPELPQSLNDIIYSRLIQEAQSGGIPPEALEKLKESLLELGKKHIKAVADDNTAKMAHVIKNMMDDSGFLSEFKAFLGDFSMMPYGVIAGPELVASPAIVHSPETEGGVDVQTKMQVKIRRLDPLSFYWTADCRSPQTGTAVFEYTAVHANALLDAIESNVPGFIPNAVKEVIDQDRQFDVSVTPYDKALDAIRKNETMTLRARGQYTCIKYHGLIPGKLLKDISPELNPQRHYECEIWTIDGKAVRVMYNVNPMSNRNFFVSSMYRQPGAMVGLGVSDKLWDTERVCNAALRSLVYNMPFASGPFGEIDKSRLANPADAENLTIQPRKLYEVDPDPFGGGSPAIRLQNISANSNEFLAVYDRFQSQADYLSGVPAFITGQLDFATMARTASGLSMMMKSASVVLQNAVGNIDEQIISPLISTMYNWVMLYHPDASIKADAKVLAQGVSGVLAKELGQSKLVDLLTLLAPYAQAGILPPTVLVMLIREIVSGTGYDVDKLIPPGAEQQVAMQSAIANANVKPGSAPPSLTNPPPMTGPGVA